LSDLAVLQ